MCSRSGTAHGINWYHANAFFGHFMVPRRHKIQQAHSAQRLHSVLKTIELACTAATYHLHTCVTLKSGSNATQKNVTYCTTVVMFVIRRYRTKQKRKVKELTELVAPGNCQKTDALVQSSILLLQHASVGMAICVQPGTLCVDRHTSSGAPGTPSRSHRPSAPPRESSSNATAGGLLKCTTGATDLDASVCA